MIHSALTLLVAALLAVVLTPVGSGRASAASPKALILRSTTTPGVGPCSTGTGSFEECAAIADGFDVTVVDDATWGAMTTADFAQYQVLIIGDPTCGDTVDGAAGANASVWQSAVMASGGNRVIIGTDPVYHAQYGYGNAVTGAPQLIQNGIAFAGAVAGATGAYVDLSCESSYTSASTPFSFLDGLTTQPAGSFTTEYPPCLGAISIVAQSGPTSGLHDSDLSDWECSVHQAFQTWASDFTPLAIATDASLAPYCADDVDTGALACGEPYILVAGAGITVTSSISLSPATATNPVGTSHTVTATVLDSTGSPVAGVTVTFAIDSGPDSGMTGTGVTDATGQTTFTYTNNGTAGTDSISASFIDASGALEKATASKTWTSVSTADPTSLTVNAATGDFADPTMVSAVLTDTNKNAPVSGESVTLTLNGVETCSATTDALGTASCSITPGEAAGPYTLAGSFAGDSSYQSSSGSAAFVVTLEETGLSYTGDTSAINGQPMTLSGVLTTDDPAAGTALSGKIVDFTLGSGGGAQTCSGTTGATGAASCTIASVNQPLGSIGVAGSFAGDAYYQPAATSSSVNVFSPPAAGAFVIGDKSAGAPQIGAQVYFWGSQWAKKNQLSGGPAPSSMKGFANSPEAFTPGSTWTTTTGNSSAPPPTLPSQIEVIVSSTITRSGSTLSGTVDHIVVVQVDPGYLNDPGHPGTGRIVSVLF